MKISKILIFQILIIFIALAVGIYYLPSLPELMPSHWNASGEIDSYINKNLFIFLIPGIAIALTALFPILSKIDPKKDKYKQFKTAWMAIQTVIISFFVYLYLITIYLAFNPEVSMLKFMFWGLGVLFVVIGNYFGKIRQNYFVGIKTPWTLNNEDIWNKTHRLAGWLWVLTGIIIFIDGFFEVFPVAVMFGSVAINVFVPFLYSYLLYPKK
ncbi:SdpI family protein [Patescibacteria group bacterium]|nr:SdpI family protein [Patescibacteria group bacterium]